MEGLTTIRLELNVAAQKIMSQMAINSEVIEEQIHRGIELAIEELSETNFVESVKAQVLSELKHCVSQGVLSYELRNKIRDQIEQKIEKKIDNYTTKVAELVTKNLK